MVRTLGIPAVLAMIPACLITSGDVDGSWEPTTGQCAPAGPAVKVLATSFVLDYFVIGGDTVLFTSENRISQVGVEDDSRRLASDSYRQGPIGTIDNALVYYDVFDFKAIDVVVDRGTAAAQRYETVSPHEPNEITSLIVIPAGVYFARGSQPGWRWSPTEGLSEYDLRSTSRVKTDGADFLYALNDVLLVKPVTGGDPTVVPVVPAVGGISPVGITPSEVFFTRGPNAQSGGMTRDLVAHSRTTGAERVVVAGWRPGDTNALGGGYFYWEQSLVLPSAQRPQLLRAPLTGGPGEVVFTGPDNSTIYRLAADDCNVYWSLIDETCELLARGH